MGPSKFCIIFTFFLLLRSSPHLSGSQRPVYGFRRVNPHAERSANCSNISAGVFTGADTFSVRLKKRVGLKSVKESFPMYRMESLNWDIIEICLYIDNIDTFCS